MAENGNSESNIDNVFDPRFQTEDLSFEQTELISCRACARSNPPNRLSCIYCGKDLEIDVDDAASIKTHLRKLELWERGINVIIREQASDITPEIDKLASFLSLDPGDLSMILDAGVPLPIARVEAQTVADLIRSGVEQVGLNCILVNDHDLDADKPPVRLSGMEIADERLDLREFNTGKVREFAISDLVLIVPGSITENKVDSLEKKGFGKKARSIAQSTTATDEAILDLYLRDEPAGFRVRMAGFDFSCLGDQKGLLAGENMQRLIGVLNEASPNAKCVDNYMAVRQALSVVWDIETRKDSKGVQRSGFGKAELNAVASTSNLNQFTKYSRLQWHLL